MPVQRWRCNVGEMPAENQILAATLVMGLCFLAAGACSNSSSPADQVAPARSASPQPPKPPCWAQRPLLDRLRRLRPPPDRLRRPRSKLRPSSSPGAASASR
jgi:hypothetical protein